MRLPHRQAILEQAHRLGGTAPGRALATGRESKLVVNTMFQVLAGRYPGPAQHARLIQRSAEGASLDELVAEVAGVEAAVDRTIDRIRPALQARLHWDYERGQPGADELPQTRVVFMHIMKTAGTSLSELCSGWVAPGRGRVHLYIDDLLLTPPAMLARLGFIAGHIPFEALEIIPGRFQTVTVLREPIARAISHYSTLRRSGPRYEDLTLEEFAFSDLYRSAAGNYQARQLAHRIDVSEAWISFSPYARLRALAEGAAGTELPVQGLFDSTPIDISDDELFETARCNLARINVVGVTDDLQTVADEVASVFKTSVKAVPREHISPPFDRSQLTDRVRKRLEQSTAVDRELYAQARSRAHKRTAGPGPGAAPSHHSASGS
jgi:hypothetical protein